MKFQAEASIRSGIPNMVKGLRLGARALTAETPKVQALLGEPQWQEALVNDDFAVPQTIIRDLTEFGYGPEAIRVHRRYQDRLGFIGPIRPLTDTGVRLLSQVAARLEKRAPTNLHIVTKRLRRANAHSCFIRDVVHSPGFLLKVSRLAGVPLIPHPHRDAAVQINYYGTANASGTSPQVAKWHTDGMDYVLTLLLSEKGSYEGGDFLYFDGTKEQFRRDDALDDRRIRIADFTRLGEAIFTKGSHIFHGVTPVTRGHRTTLVISFFCPFFARQDANRFWHSAPDDGFFRTLANWLSFKMPWQSADYFFERSGVPRSTWNELQD